MYGQAEKQMVQSSSWLGRLTKKEATMGHRNSSLSVRRLEDRTLLAFTVPTALPIAPPPDLGVPVIDPPIAEFVGYVDQRASEIWDFPCHNNLPSMLEEFKAGRGQIADALQTEVEGLGAKAEAYLGKLANMAGKDVGSLRSLQARMAGAALGLMNQVTAQVQKLQVQQLMKHSVPRFVPPGDWGSYHPVAGPAEDLPGRIGRSIEQIAAEGKRLIREHTSAIDSALSGLRDQALGKHRELESLIDDVVGAEFAKATEHFQSAYQARHDAKFDPDFAFEQVLHDLNACVASTFRQLQDGLPGELSAFESRAPWF